MKVVLFCGGQGLRLRDYPEAVPKPMVPVGYRPILWHIMKYYAHHGHKDFVLCLGYKAHVIKEFFLRYNEALSNDFVMGGGGERIQLLSRDIEDWTITFADTGLNALVGERLRAVRRYVADDDIFLATYGDGLTDAPLNALVDRFVADDKVAAFLCVRPSYTFHVISMDDRESVTEVVDVQDSDIWINGGFFIFRREIFDYIEEGEELVHEPFRRLIRNDQLAAYRYNGFWAPMDTLKDVHRLEALHETGQPPWAVWRDGSAP
jgi:glucose-1-phosphate cytidylyltransferase